jgi:hypothetical protein
MQVNRGLVFWGVALVTAGIVALAIQSGAIDRDTARGAWRLWPVALIVVGLAVIAARSPLALVATLLAGLVVGGLGGTFVAGVPDGLSLGCGNDTNEQLTDEGAFTTDIAEVDLDLNCGEMAVGMGPGSDWRVSAAHGADEAPSITKDGERLRVEAEGAGIIGFADVRQSWDITVPLEVELDLSVSAHAASSRLDLSDGQFSAISIDANAGEVVLGLIGATANELSIDANAGSVSIDADESTVVSGSIGLNAGSLELCLTEDADAAITLNDDNVTFSHNLDDLGLSRSGDTWRWGSGTGTPAIALEVEGNAASFTLNPEGGCA